MKFRSPFNKLFTAIGTLDFNSTRSNMFHTERITYA
jgi:hypothetical protein